MGKGDSANRLYSLRRVGLFRITDLDSGTSDNKSIFFWVDVCVLALKPRSSEDNSMVKESWYNVEEDAGLTVPGDIEGAVCYFRNPNFRRFIKGNHTALSYGKTRELEPIGYTCID